MMTKIIDPVHTQLLPFFNARKNFYQLLHHLFSIPSNFNSFCELRDKGNLIELENIHEGGRILHEFFENLSDEQMAIELQEYKRLFIGPGPLGAPLWESYYLSKEHLLFEECTYQVRKEYHRHNLQFIKENNEPDDHLLLEIEFLVLLIDKCLGEENNDKVKRLLTDQINFLEQHLILWIPAFLNQLQKNTKSKLYIGAAMLLNEFLTFDLLALKDVKEAIDYV